MGKRKPRPKAKPHPTEPKQDSLALPAHPARDELDDFPHQLRAGDRFTDATGHVWVVAYAPSGLQHGPCGSKPRIGLVVTPYEAWISTTS
jgi:hypothetical protein